MSTVERQVFEGPEAEVTLVRIALERDGIRTEVRYRSSTHVRLRGAVYVVLPQDLIRARAVIARYMKGALPSEAALAQPWTCPSCGERVEGQFQACWSCGTAKP